MAVESNNQITPAEQHLSEQDVKKLSDANTINDSSIDDVPSANMQGRDNDSSKKLRNLGILVVGILIMIAGIVMASSRYSQNKEERKAKEAAETAQAQKQISTGTVDIASDQAAIESSKMYDIPPPADAAIDPTVGSVDPMLDAQSATSTYETEPYTPPQPVPNSQKYQPIETMSYTPPPPSYNAPQPSPPFSTQSEDPKPVYEEVVDMPLTELIAPSVKGASSDVLVDVYGVEKVAANQNGDRNSASNRNDTLETAKRRANTNFLLTKGTNIPCVLKTKIDSTYQGFTVCQTTKDVYSANGKILLLERGSQVFGEQNVELQQGQARVAIIWTRAETPKGVSVNLDSPATGKLGQMGVGARVNNHFWKRFGGAIMLSIIQDAISAGTSRLEKNDKANGDNNTTIQNTSSTAESMAEKALDNTINIPPTATVNAGTLVNILVVKDIDFSSVYGVRRAN